MPPLSPSNLDLSFDRYVGMSSSSIAIPLWTLVVPFVALTARSFWIKPFLPHQGPKCRYDLTGITTTCPECGSPIARTKKPAGPETDGSGE